MLVRPLVLCVGLLLLQSPAIAEASPAPRAAPGQGEPQAPALTISLRALKALLARIPAATPGIRRDWMRADRTVSRLLDLSAKWPATSPLDYRTNLARDALALDAAIRRGNPAPLAATLQAIADDLEIKLEHCIRSGGKLGGSVAVHVRTFRGSDEIKSWQVFYIPKVLEVAGDASPDLFPQLSSPTSESLVPGRYAMWLRNPTTNTLGERTIVKIGEGKKDLALDLPVPPDAAR